MKNFLISFVLTLLVLGIVITLSFIFELEREKSAKVEQVYLIADKPDKTTYLGDFKEYEIEQTSNSFVKETGSGEFVLSSIPTIDTTLFIGDVAEDVIVELMLGKNNIVNGFKLPAGKTYILEQQEDGTVNLTWE